MMLLAVGRPSALLGIPPDQVAFFVAQVLAIFFSFLLKTYVPPRKNTTTCRHLAEFVVGTIVMYLCYEDRVVLLFIQAVPAYLMTAFLPPHVAQYTVMFFTLTFLSFIHIQRLNYTGSRLQSVDITAPLMIQTQKLSSLAFNLYDGNILAAGKEVAKESHKLHAIKKPPKLLPFWGYLLCFQNSMVGPFLFYTDYLCFIEGREEDQVCNPLQREFIVKNKGEIREAKVRFIGAALKIQTLGLLFHLLLTFYASGRYVPEYLISDEFERLGIFRKYFWLTIYGFYLRQKFYCAWSLSALAMLVSGFGFSGLSSDGAMRPEYRNAINVRFFGIELGTNTKTILDNWNTGATRWLRECVYDRTPKRFAVVAVFFVSAFWHGFYPVYYLCFLSAALLTITGRLCRTLLRPCFLENYWHHSLYDLLTNMAALFSLNYLGVAFSLLDTSMALKLWGNFYYLGHVVPLLVLFLLPYALPNNDTTEGRKSVVDVTYALNVDPASAATVTGSPLQKKSA